MKICLECATPNPFRAIYCYACGELFRDDALPGPSHRLHSGQVLHGQYAIARPLGRGGMGVVYLASQTIAGRQRQVVVKEMLEYLDFNDPQGKMRARQRFEAEAATLVSLNLAGIPQIFDYFSEGEHNYIVMQYIEGHNLQAGLTHEDENGQLVAGQPYPAKQVRRWGIRLCKVLEKMAVQNVVHMDIKPANLILDHSGDVWLVDFGTARAHRSAQTGGGAGMQLSSIYGTMGYAPMEQYQQQAEPRSDVYALAATLYHLLTDDDPRSHPFQFSKIKQLPADLATALKQALVQDVDQRITAAQFHRLLEVRPAVGSTFRWQDETVSASPEGLVEPALRNWAEARDYFNDGSWEQWFHTLHRNDILAQLVQAKDQNEQDDVALDAFLRALDPTIPPPDLQLAPPALEFGLVPWQTEQTVDLEIQNVGSGCLYGKLVDLPPWLRLSPAEAASSTEQPGPTGYTPPDRQETTKLTAASPPLTGVPTRKFIPPDRQETAKLTAASPSLTTALPASWFVAPDRQTIQLTVDAGMLTPRAEPYTANLIIKLGPGSPGQAQVPVTVTVPEPRLALSPSLLDLGLVNRGEWPAGALIVSNPGQSAFEGQAQCAAGWISFEPARFRCEPGASVQVAVKAGTSQLRPGQHTAPVKVQAQAGKWRQSGDVQTKVHLPWLKSIWYRWSPILDAAAEGMLLAVGLFGLTRSLLGFAPFIGAFSILVLVIGGLLAFTFPKAFVVSLLMITGLGLGYIADLWLGLAPTLALAGVIGMIFGAGLRPSHTERWRWPGLLGGAVLLSIGVVIAYFVTQPSFWSYWWRRIDTVNTGSTGVALSPDGTTLASTAQDETVQLWHVTGGAPVHALNRHKGQVTDVTFSADGTLLASASEDTTVWLWRATSGTPVRMLAGHIGRVLSLAFSVDGTLLASGTDDGTIWLWRAGDGSLVKTLKGHTGSITSLAFSPGGMLLASGGSDAKVRLWQAAKGELLYGLTEHTGQVTSLTFSPDGALLASGSGDRTIRLWPVAECTPQPERCQRSARALAGHTGAVTSVAFSPDGTMIASGGDDKNIKLWRASDGALLRTLKGSREPIYKVAFTPDGTLVSTGQAGATQLWWVGQAGKNP